MKCKSFLDLDEITQPQNHSHAKILFIQAFVIASLNVILPEENKDINSAIKLLFLDILKDYGSGLFKAFSKFKNLERNENYGMRANKYCVYCTQELYENEKTKEEIGCCLNCNLYAFHDKCAIEVEDDSLKDICPYCILSNELEKCIRNSRSIVIKKCNENGENKKFTVNKRGRKILIKQTEQESNLYLLLQKQCKSKMIKHMYFLALFCMFKFKKEPSLTFRMSHMLLSIMNNTFNKVSLDEEATSLIAVILNKFHLQENMMSIMSNKLALYSYQKYLLAFELREQIKYIHNTFMFLLDSPLASVKNKALESVRASITDYLNDAENCNNEYGVELMGCICERLEFLIGSKNPSTRYNALDILSCIIEGSMVENNKANVNLEDHLDLLLERLYDVSNKVKRKAIDIVCLILERSEEFESKNNTFIKRNGLQTIVSMLNSLRIQNKDDSERAIERVSKFFMKILFTNECYLLIQTK